MAVKVSVGDVFTEIKRGTNAKGDWVIAIARADKGTDRISVSVSNPTEIPEDSYAVEVVEIESTEVTANNVNGKWYKNFTCTAKCRSVEGGATPTDIGDTDLPF